LPPVEVAALIVSLVAIGELEAENRRLKGE
jgi:hypothetical protein